MEVKKVILIAVFLVRVLTVFLVEVSVRVMVIAVVVRQRR